MYLGGTMKKTLKVARLADFELKRYEEVMFYLNIKHIFNVFGHTQTTYEFIEMICQVADASVTLIKTLTSNINAANSPVKPSSWELAILLYRNDVVLTDIVKASGFSHRTIYRMIKAYNAGKEVDSQFMPRIKDEYHEHITKFNKKLKELLTYDGYTV